MQNDKNNEDQNEDQKFNDEVHVDDKLNKSKENGCSRHLINIMTM